MSNALFFHHGSRYNDMPMRQCLKTVFFVGGRKGGNSFPRPVHIKLVCRPTSHPPASRLEVSQYMPRLKDIRLLPFFIYGTNALLCLPRNDNIIYESAWLITGTTISVHRGLTYF
jgi:hypothetical protein